LGKPRFLTAGTFIRTKNWGVESGGLEGKRRREKYEGLSQAARYKVGMGWVGGEKVVRFAQSLGGRVLVQ